MGRPHSLSFASTANGHPVTVQQVRNVTYGAAGQLTQMEALRQWLGQQGASYYTRTWTYNNRLQHRYHVLLGSGPGGEHQHKLRLLGEQ